MSYPLKGMKPTDKRKIYGGHLCKCGICGYMSNSYVFVLMNSICCGMKHQTTPIVKPVIKKLS